MTTIWFACIGIFALCALLATQKFAGRWGAPAFATCLVLGLCFAVVREQPGRLGNPQWFNVTPFKEAVMFSLMVLGMMARVFTLAIEDMRSGVTRGKRPKITRWELIYPLFFSLPTFMTLLPNIPSGSLNIANMGLAFQTGFFWQTVMKSFERTRGNESKLTPTSQ